MIEILSLFFTFLSALIVKDLYDIFISKYIRQFFLNNKKTLKEVLNYVSDGKNKTKNNKKK